MWLVADVRMWECEMGGKLLYLCPGRASQWCTMGCNYDCVLTSPAQWESPDLTPVPGPRTQEVDKGQPWRSLFFRPCASTQKQNMENTHWHTRHHLLHSLLHTRPHPSLCQLSSSSLNAESLTSICIGMTLKSIFEEHKRHILNTKNGFPWRLFQHMQT